MKRWSAIIISAALWVGAVQASDKDGLCDALDAYAKAIPAATTRSLTLKTEWGAEPTTACVSVNEAPEKKLCAYLSESVSREFMAANIKRFLICLGSQFPDSDGLWFDSLFGKVRSSKPAFTREPVTAEFEFGTGSNDDLPFIKISMTRD